MGIVSLKLTIGGVSAFAVALVASITLSIALTTSFDALRALGRRHSVSLLEVAEVQTAHLFEQTSDAALSIRNLTESMDLALPWKSEYTRNVSVNLVFQIKRRLGSSLSSVIIIWADGSEFWSMGAASDPDRVQAVLTKIAHGPHVGPTQPSNFTFRDHFFFVQANGPSPPEYSGMTPLDTESARTNGYWSTVVTASFGGFSPAMVPPVATLLNTGGARMYIPAGTPIYTDPSGPRDSSNMKGFALANLGIELIGRFLRATKSTPNTAAFAYDGQGFLISSSEDASVTAVSEQTSTVVPLGCSAVVGSSAQRVLICRKRVSDYGHGALQAFAASHRESMFPEAGVRSAQLLQLAGSRAYIATVKVPLAFRGLELFLLLVMPEADVLGDIITGQNAAIGVTCALVIFFAVANVALIMALLAPLSAIAGRMNRAATFEDDETDDTVSAMSEVADLQLAYYAMNEELNRIRSYVPQSVLVAKRRENGDEDEDAEGSLADLTGATSTRQDETQSNRSNRSNRSRRSKRSGHGSADKRSQRSGGALAGVHDIGGLAQRAVTVVCGNLVGLHATIARSKMLGIADAAAQQISATVHLFEAEVGTHQGVLAFHGDRFLATFNAARPCASHASRALKAALALSAPSEPGNCRVACGVDTGRCAVGSMGSGTMKTFSTVGPAVANAAALERRVHKIFPEQNPHRLLLVSHRTLSDAPMTDVVPVLTDMLPLQSWSGKRVCSVATFPAGAEETAEATEVPSVNEQPTDDEWLYVVGGARRSIGLAVLNPVFEFLTEGDVPGAQNAFEKLQPQVERAYPPAAERLRVVLGILVNMHQRSDSAPTAADLAAALEG